MCVCICELEKERERERENVNGLNMYFSLLTCRSWTETDETELHSFNNCMLENSRIFLLNGVFSSFCGNYCGNLGVILKKCSNIWIGNYRLITRGGRLSCL